MHWSRVWERLAERHRVVAPDLPGLGWLEQAPLASVRQYAEWLVALLDGLQIERAVCVGNSFGASVVWSLAGRAPERCAQLVLVNGVPMPKTPAPMRWLGGSRAGRACMRAVLRKVSYHPKLIERAFVDARCAPATLREMLAEREPLLLRRFADLLIAGDGAPTPKIPPILLWGEADRLPGTDAAHALRLHASLPGSILRWVTAAGHFPELENPDAFIERLEQRA